jgi:phage baseplate assembly protein W
MSETWSDLHPALIQDAQGRLKVVTDVAAVMSSIDSILRISPGECVFLPQLGCGLDSLVFENITPTLAKLLSREIKEKIEIWDNRVSVTDVSFDSDPDKSSVTIVVQFSVKGLPGIFKYQSNLKGF